VLADLGGGVFAQVALAQVLLKIFKRLAHVPNVGRVPLHPRHGIEVRLPGLGERACLLPAFLCLGRHPEADDLNRVCLRG